jgi:hypothetical protein
MNAEPGGIDADQIDARFTQTRIANTRALSRPLSVPGSGCADQMHFPLLGFERH